MPNQSLLELAIKDYLESSPIIVARYKLVTVTVLLWQLSGASQWTPNQSLLELAIKDYLESSPIIVYS